jgi:hypothetical protein
MGYLGSPIAKQINAKGFRKWHEYELVRAFGFLGLGVLGLIAAMASLEGILETRFSLAMLPKYLVTFGGLCLAGWAWIRFVSILGLAENLSRQAICPNCKRYGLLIVTDERSSPDQQERMISVTCKKCQHAWKLVYTLESMYGHK